MKTSSIERNCQRTAQLTHLLLTLLFLTFAIVSGFSNSLPLCTEGHYHEQKVTIVPSGFKKVKKRSYNKYALSKGHHRFQAYSHSNGCELFFYSTKRKWDNSRGGLRLWEVPSELTKKFVGYKWMESGFHKLNGSDVLFVLLAKSNTDGASSTALIVLQNVDNKIAYSIYLEPRHNPGYFNKVTRAMLMNQLPELK